MKNTFRLVGGLLLVAVLLAGLSTLTVSAQGPTATATPGTSPVGQTPAGAPPAAAAAGVASDNPLAAATVGSAIPAVPAGQATWVKFNYGTNGYQTPRPPVTIRLLNGVTTGLGFEVWAPEQMQGNWFDNKPIGRGTPETLPGTKCLASSNLPASIDTNGNIIDANGNNVGSQADQNAPQLRDCQTNDLVWVGGFGADGTYFVRIVNTNSDTTGTNNANTATGSNTKNGNAQLIISGPGIAECQSGALQNNAGQANGQSYSIEQCQNPTLDQLQALSTATNTGTANSSAPAAAPTVAATATESATVAATSAATAIAPAATSAATAVATSTTTSGASSSAGSSSSSTASTPAAAPSVSAVPTCTPTPTPGAGTSTPEPTSAVAGTPTPSPTPNCVMPSSSGSTSSSSSSSSMEATPAASATP